MFCFCGRSRAAQLSSQESQPASIESYGKELAQCSTVQSRTAGDAAFVERVHALLLPRLFIREVSLKTHVRSVLESSMLGPDKVRAGPADDQVVGPGAESGTAEEEGAGGG